MTGGWYHELMSPTEFPIDQTGRLLRELRSDLGWSQRELGRRSGVPQTAISRIERGRLAAMDLEQLVRAASAAGARLRLVVDAPFLADRSRQRDRVHARCIGFVASRLAKAGWDVLTEVEISGRRGPGWIDILAGRRETADLLVIEIKTEIDDIGAIQRRLSWFAHAASPVARGLGWVQRRSAAALIVLSPGVVHARLRENRDLIRFGFPGTAAGLGAWIRDEHAPPPLWTVALIDPFTRSRDWLRNAVVDGRSAVPRDADYAAVARRLSGAARNVSRHQR